MWCFSLEIHFVNKVKSAGIFRRLVQIRNITLCEAPMLQKLDAVDENLVPRAFHLSDVGQAQGTNDTPSPPSDIRKERCLGCEVSFMTKY